MEPGKGKEADRGKDLELVPLPKLEVEALRFPLISLDPLPLFLHPEPYARISCVLIFKL